MLLAGTAVAFAVTELLKLTPSPILDTAVDTTFSPSCACSTRTAHIAFRLRKPDRITITVTWRGSVVRTLVSGYRRRLVRTIWNGREDSGKIAPNAAYLARVHLALARRTIVLPNPITLDTRPPVAKIATPRPRIFSPDGDRRNDRITVTYRFDEVARPILLINGRPRVIGRFAYRAGTLTWYGKAGSKTFGVGSYRLSVVGRDAAGNLSRPSSPQTVTLRYIELLRHRIVAARGQLIRVAISADAVHFRWVFAGRRGRGSPRILLVLRAPRRAGRYALVVSERGHRDRALVTIR